MVADNNVVLVSASISRRGNLPWATIANSYTRRFDWSFSALPWLTVSEFTLLVLIWGSSQGANKGKALILFSFVKFADWLAQNNAG